MQNGGIQRRSAATIEDEAPGMVYVVSRQPGRQARVIGNDCISPYDDSVAAVANIEGESVLLNLDMHNVCASAGSACSATSLEPSHVLQAMGIPVHRARGALRLSVGHGNTSEEIEHVLELLPGIVNQLRAMAVV